MLSSMHDDWTSAAFRDALLAMVRRRVPPADADDVVQAALTEAVASTDRPRDREEARRWIWGVARNKVADYHRRQRREVVGAVPEQVAPHDRRPAPLVEAPEIAALDARVQRMRDEALRACDRREWTRCVEGLDAARSLDPIGDAAPAVQRARQLAHLALTPPPPPPPPTTTTVVDASVDRTSPPTTLVPSPTVTRPTVRRPVRGWSDAGVSPVIDPFVEVVRPRPAATDAN